MSFILDALKKAESERGRAAGPVLVDVRIAPPRRRLPAWAWVLGAVLLANLAALAWLMWRTPMGPVSAVAMPTAGNPEVAPAPNTGVAATAGAAASSGAAANAPMTLPPSPLPPPTLPPSTMPSATSPPGGSSAFPATPELPPPSPSRAADLDNLPTQRDLQNRGITLPPLLLNLHVYDPTPSLRYVMLNGLRLKEGDFTPDGIKVEAVTEGGVVLEARGQRFLLPTGN